MILRFRLFITLLLTICSISFSGVIFMVNSEISKQNMLESKQRELDLVQLSVVNSLENVDKAYEFLDGDISSKMEEITSELMDKYKSSSDFNNWNFSELKELYGMDIYIIDSSNTIIHSTSEEDKFLSFPECCEEFSNVLDERRNSGGFYTDGLDIVINTGEVKKFSYKATSDKKYIFELGYSIFDDKLYKEFNFLDTIDELEANYPMVDKINVYNSQGYLFGKVSSKIKRVSEDHLDYFKRTLKNNKVLELDGTIGDRKVKYRYIPYNVGYSGGIYSEKVVEIIYNDLDTQLMIYESKRKFGNQIILTLIVAVLLSNIIAMFVSRPMYFAFHDSLTGLKNRASYEAIFRQKLLRNKNNSGILIIDLDNFKNVNDTYGHDVGDIVLKWVSREIKRNLRPEDVAIRLGGDEFLLLLPNISNNDSLRIVGERLVTGIYNLRNMEDNGELAEVFSKLDVTASVGGCLYIYGNDNADELFKKADKSLYVSKKKGKNICTIYGEKYND